MLGVTRPRAGDTVDSAPDFPRCRAHVEGRPVWVRREVEVWLATRTIREAPWVRPWNCKPGRRRGHLFAILQLAVKESHALDHTWVGEEHLLLALFRPECPGIMRGVLASAGLTRDAIRQALSEIAGPPVSSESKGKPVLPLVQYVLERAIFNAVELRDEQVRGEHVLLALLGAPNDSRAVRLLAEQRIDVSSLAQDLVAFTDGHRSGLQETGAAARVSRNVDVADVARILGVSRKRVAELVGSAAGFPSSHSGRRGQRMWVRREVESWAVANTDRGAQRRKLTLPAPGSAADEVEQVVEIAKGEARELHDGVVLPDHLFLALLHPECPGGARAPLESFGLTLAGVRRIKRQGPARSSDCSTEEIVSPPETSLVLERAALRALELEDETVSGLHVLLALLEQWNGWLPLGFDLPPVHVTKLYDHLVMEDAGMMPSYPVELS